MPFPLIMSPDDLSEWLPIVIFAVVMVIVVLIVIVTVVFSIVLSLSPFAVLGWVFSKKSKEAKAAVAASQSWLPTNGRVLKSRVEVISGRYTSVKPYVLYEYQVNSQTYQSDMIRASDKIMVIQRGSRAAYDTIDRYPEGASVTVYYNPQNPSEAVLER